MRPVEYVEEYFERVEIDYDKCRGCNFCLDKCYSPDFCTGCLACYYACPNQARYIVRRLEKRKLVTIYVEDAAYKVPEGITVLEALRRVGLSLNPPGKHNPSVACRTGGCWACAVLIDGKVERACITPVRDGMKISLDVRGVEPRRIVHGPSPHTVGGKATPWYEVDYVRYVEVAIWVAGCNLRCPQCQNYAITYENRERPLTPEEAARLVLAMWDAYRTPGVAISGGEPTLNRSWLVKYFQILSSKLPEKVRRHLDSNGTLLTPDYIDELIEAGCNNIGVEPKCVQPETYMKITGISDRDLALKYLNTAWRAIEYICERYLDKVYLGVGLVYNPKLISLDEVAEAGRKIASINPDIQVVVLDYFPAFRRRDLTRPSVREMLKVKKILEDQGLRCVIVQTKIGHVGPGNRRVTVVDLERYLEKESVYERELTYEDL